MYQDKSDGILSEYHEGNWKEVVAWPTQSPNLNLSEFFMRGFSKSYTKLPLTHAWKHGMVQAAARVQSNGWHFEHVAITMILNTLL
jgi:hypothetical protein